MYIYRNEKLMYMDKTKRQSLANTFIKEVLMFDDCILMIDDHCQYHYHDHDQDQVHDDQDHAKDNDMMTIMIE